MTADNEQPPAAAMADPVVANCVECGRSMTRAEGGTVFTVCDRCWPINPAASLNLARLRELVGQVEEPQP